MLQQLRFIFRSVNVAKITVVKLDNFRNILSPQYDTVTADYRGNEVQDNTRRVKFRQHHQRILRVIIRAKLSSEIRCGRMIGRVVITITNSLRP